MQTSGIATGARSNGFGVSEHEADAGCPRHFCTPTNGLFRTRSGSTRRITKQTQSIGKHHYRNKLVFVPEAKKERSQRRDRTTPSTGRAGTNRKARSQGDRALAGRARALPHGPFSSLEIDLHKGITKRSQFTGNPNHFKVKRIAILAFILAFGGLTLESQEAGSNTLSQDSLPPIRSKRPRKAVGQTRRNRPAHCVRCFDFPV